jgi:hypothetical protein
LLGLIFDPEDGGNMLHQNVDWVSVDYVALYPRRQNSSTHEMWCMSSIPQAMAGAMQLSVVTIFSESLNWWSFHTDVLREEYATFIIFKTHNL